jgi:hypothetical protein
MTPEQKRFFVAVVIVAGICIVATLSASAFVRRDLQKNIRQAESDAERALLEAREHLLSDANPEFRLAEADRLAQEAVRILQSSTDARGVTGILLSLLPASSAHSAPSAVVSRQALSLSDALTAVVNTLPAMKRLAGYDAGADLRNATGLRDLYLRLYTARDGLGNIIEDLDHLPLSERYSECRSAVSFARIAFDETEPLISNLESDAASAPDTSRYVSAALDASQHASRAVTSLLSEEHLQQLAHLAQ